MLSGRYSEWEYYTSDYVFLADMKAAEKIIAGRTGMGPASAESCADALAR
jgi:hypothetical protein